jgi:polyvinyl alcohol dehydrogenase (cytochrome)
VQTDVVRTRLGLAAATLAAFGLAACSSPSPPAAHAPVPNSTGSPGSSSGVTLTPSPADWTQYHANGARTGSVAGLPAAGQLAADWSRPLGGAVYGQPLVIGSTVIAASESDEVYGLRLRTGAVLWRTKVGVPLPLTDQPCGNINPLGITSTPLYDPQTRLVYVVAQSGRTGHVLVGLRPSDGRVELRRAVPSPDHQPYYDQQRGALALADGHIDIVFGGHYGDCGPYIGAVVGVPASGHGPIWSYRVPAARQAAIWAAAGPVVSPSGTIYVATGNGAASRPPFDEGDSVIALTARLHQTGVFAPSDWATLNADDLDLGSMSPVMIGAGKILQVGKSGVGYLLDADRLGGVGGQLSRRRICVAFGGAAVTGTTVYVPCWQSGLIAARIVGNHIQIRWQASGDAWGSPVAGGGAVWVAEPYDGTLYELAPGSGRTRYKLKVAGSLPDFVSPSLSGDLVLIGTFTGVTAVSGA